MAATTTEVREKLDLALNALEGELTDLSSILEDQQRGDLPSLERDVRAMEWGQVMGTLRTILDPACRAGQMTPEQVARYRALLVRLKEALPIIERLGFAKPTISLEP
uniref:Uncharacterized protein n=1 Tax=Thermorudis peleae TaxID=1382356 RepID=A0A831X782_9BACT